MEALGINLGYLLVQIVNFSLLFILMRALVFNPLMDMLDRRADKIQKGVDEADRAEEAISKANVEAEQVIAEARRTSTRIIHETTDRAEEAAREIRNAAMEKTSADREAAMAEVAQEKEEMMSKMRAHVSELAIAASQHLIGESLKRDEEYHHQLLQEFFSGIKDGELSVTSGDLQRSGMADAEVAEVISALPLTKEEQSLVQKRLLSNFENLQTVSFRVDPAILGGLILRVGDHVMDGSVFGQLQGMSRSLR